MFHTAVLPVLCVMFLVQLSVVVNLLSVFLVWIPDFSLNLCCYSGGPSYDRYNHTWHVPTFVRVTSLSAGIATSISVHVFCFLCLIIIFGLFDILIIIIIIIIIMPKIFLFLIYVPSVSTKYINLGGHGPGEGGTFFEKSRSNLKILGARRVT